MRDFLRSDLMSRIILIAAWLTVLLGVYLHDPWLAGPAALIVLTETIERTNRKE